MTPHIEIRFLIDLSMREIASIIDVKYFIC